MDTQNTSRQFRYLEEVRIPLHRAGFETLPLEGAQLPVLWNGAPLCRITGKGSVFYRRENADTPQAEDTPKILLGICQRFKEAQGTDTGADGGKASHHWTGIQRFGAGHILLFRCCAGVPAAHAGGGGDKGAFISPAG